MAQITKRTPTNYRNRHKDWYNGIFRDVCHQIGVVGELLFYLDCESKAQFVDSLNPMQNIFPFENIEQWIKGMFKRHYENKYTQVYDEWALQACKSFEMLEGKFNEVFGDIKSKVDEAKAYIEANLIKPLKDKINKEIIPQVNNVLSKIRDAESQVRSIENKVSEELEPLIKQVELRMKYAEGTVKYIQRKMEDAVSKVNNLDELVKKATSDLENFRSKLNESIETLNSHTNNISELFDRVRNLEAGTPSGSAFDDLVRRVREALI